MMNSRSSDRMLSRAVAAGMRMGMAAISRGPRIAANLPTILKNPKNSALRDFGMKRAYSDRLRLWTPPWTRPMAVARR